MQKELEENKNCERKGSQGLQVFIQTAEYLNARFHMKLNFYAFFARNT